MSRTALFAVVALFVSAQARAVEVDDEALRLAKELTTAGAATFDKKDAQAMAAYYTEDAQLVLVEKSKERQDVNTELKRGRVEIEEFYRSLFKDERDVKSKNTVELARMLSPEILVIYGVFEPNASHPLKVPFFQVRVKKEGRWLMQSLTIFVVAQ